MSTHRMSFSERASSALATIPLAMLLGYAFLAVPAAQAIPSMARQTGYACAKCHTSFPELTPFGRQFKLGAYAMSSAKWDAKPFLEKIPGAALLQVSRTQTRNTNSPDAMPENFNRDRDTIVQAAGVYYGGKITNNSGALIQYNYNGFEDKWGMEMFDLRYGNQKTFGKDEKELIWGVTLNNSPTVSDIYNSTPMWGFPHTDSGTVMPNASTLVDMTLASQVGGIGVYGLWDDLIYGEFAVYRTAKRGFFRFVALGDTTDTVLAGNAPYWRFALQKETGPHSFEVGTYGMIGKVQVDSEDKSLGSDRFRDYALDASYQYIKGDHTMSAHTTWIKEKQDWNASFPLGMSSSPSTNLKTSRTDFHYFFKRRWGGGLQYFQTSGSANDMRYNMGDAVMGSANGSPNSKGWVTELNFLPIQNLKLALRFTDYQTFNGASRNYDGHGRNASDNNSVFLLAWLLL
jgi:hypothetical protein